MPATLKVFPPIIPPTPCSPFQLSRSFISNLGRDVPLLRSPPFHPYGRRVQVPSFSILPALASPLRPLPPLHICIPTLPRHPDPRTRTHPWPPPSTTRPGSHLGGSAAAAQKAALLQLGSGCCSRLLLYLLLLLSSPPLPSTGPGALSQSILVRCPGVRISATDFFPHPPTPSFVPTRLELPLLPRPPPLAPRDGHALSGGCCAGAAGLLKGPAAAIRHAPVLSLARLEQEFQVTVPPRALHRFRRSLL